MTGPFTVPDQLEFALDLPRDVRAALSTAWFTRDGWRVATDHHALLKPFSLVDCRQPLLSAFGARVRRVLMKGGAS